MAAGSQPLAFAELALGGLLITSAITGETMGELLTNGLTDAGKARLHAKNAGAGGGSFGEGSEGGEATTEFTTPGAGEPGKALPVGSTAPDPRKLGAIALPKTPGKGNDYKHLLYGLERSTEYKNELERNVKAGLVSPKDATKMYYAKFPWAEQWNKEFQQFIRNAEKAQGK